MIYDCSTPELFAISVVLIKLVTERAYHLSSQQLLRRSSLLHIFQYLDMYATFVSEY